MDSILQAGAISAPLQVIIDRLATFTVQEASLILGVDEEVRKLQRSLERIRTMVDHIEQNGFNKAWNMWLEDVEALSYAADDLLDSVSLDLLKHRANRSGGEQQVRDMIFSSFQFTVPREISRIRKELEDLVKEMDAVYVAELTKLGCVKSCSSYSFARSSMVGEGSVIGRDQEIDYLIGVLLGGGGNESNVSVVPVVGMGGVGKTTLAQLVYNHERIVDKFDMKMWASVSTNFDAIGITKSIIESELGRRCKLSELDAVQVKLRDLIAGKKFLLVLDDYWSEGYMDWDVLSAPLRFGASGSKIILTTRSMMVSHIVGTVPFINLECLSDENCWEIMKQRASSNRTLDVQLEEIGRRIAVKCNGLPLAAKSLGSMLHFKEYPAEWTSVLESEIWDLPLEKNDVFPALSLSYHHLPAQLKKCFTYCSMFPKNYDFDMNELVLLWMAEGFVHSTGKMRVEDVGVKYFKNLLWRSFFQRSGVNNHGRDIYKMHDLIHSMAQLFSLQSCLCLESNQPNQCTLLKNTRYLTLHCMSVQPVLLTGCSRYENLRTFRVAGRIQVSCDLFLKLKLLRVLDLSRTGLLELPDTIDHLKHLRFLNLSEPETLANLFGLQTLKLELCFQLLELPSCMKNMVSLRHLHMDIKQLTRMPAEFGKLVNLHSLPAFIVGKNEGYGVGELKNMKCLRGCICIKNLENVRSVNDAEEAQLHTKPFLDKLELEWDASGSRVNDGAILAGLRPHENLKEFVMTNYGGFLLPGWFNSQLCKLTSISLIGCTHYHILAPLGKLQHLKSVAIEGMSDWHHVDQEFCGFPSLEFLTIQDIPNLFSWQFFSGSRRFPRLDTLRIDDCPMLTNLPSLLNTSLLRCLNLNRCPKIRCLPDDGLPLSLQSLIITDCDIIKDRCRVEEGADWYKIRSVPRIEIDNMEIDEDMRKF